MALLRLRTRQRIMRLIPAAVLLCLCIYLSGSLQSTGSQVDFDAVDDALGEDGAAGDPADSVRLSQAPSRLKLQGIAFPPF